MTDKASPPTPLSLSELRQVLTDEIRGIQDGTSTAQKANAISNLAGKMLSSVKLEIEYHRLSGRNIPVIPMLGNGTPDTTK